MNGLPRHAAPSAAALALGGPVGAGPAAAAIAVLVATAVSLVGALWLAAPTAAPDRLPVRLALAPVAAVGAVRAPSAPPPGYGGYGGPRGRQPGLPPRLSSRAGPSAEGIEGAWLPGDAPRPEPDPAVESALAMLRGRAHDARGDQGGLDEQSGLRPAPAALTALEHALDQVGDPYLWGATGPDTYDCSGLTWRSYLSAGVLLPRVSRDQHGTGGAPVDTPHLLPGDLVFFATAAWDPGVVHHVGLYLGAGLMVEAPRPGLRVQVSEVPAAGYVGAVRPVPAVAAEPLEPAGEAPDSRQRPSVTPSAAPVGPATAVAGEAAPATPSAPSESVAPPTDPGPDSPPVAPETPVQATSTPALPAVPEPSSPPAPDPAGPTPASATTPPPGTGG